MATEKELEQEVKLILMELMLVLHKHGIKEIHMGALMRLIGVDESVAQESDHERIILDKKFTKYITDTINLSEVKSSNQTIH